MRLGGPIARQIQKKRSSGGKFPQKGAINSRSTGLARVVRAWLNGSSPVEVQACSAMLRIRVTSGSQVAIASAQTPKYQLPAPASQNRTNRTAFTQRNRAILSAPLETKLSCDTVSSVLLRRNSDRNKGSRCFTKVCPVRSRIALRVKLSLVIGNGADSERSGSSGCWVNL